MTSHARSLNENVRLKMNGSALLSSLRDLSKICQTKEHVSVDDEIKKMEKTIGKEFIERVYARAVRLNEIREEREAQATQSTTFMSRTALREAHKGLLPVQKIRTDQDALSLVGETLSP